MQISINLNVSALDHESWSSFVEEVKHCLARVPSKITAIVDRPPGCLCTSPEDDDIVRNGCGLPVGTISITYDPPAPT